MKGKISINETGVVTLTASVQMRNFEIAELFGVMTPTVKSKIRAILKAGIANSICANSGTVIGSTIIPDLHGLDMIVAIAFRIQSYKAGIFRKWIIHKMTIIERQPIVLQCNCNVIRLSDQN